MKCSSSQPNVSAMYHVLCPFRDFFLQPWIVSSHNAPISALLDTQSELSIDLCIFLSEALFPPAVLGLILLFPISEGSLSSIAWCLVSSKPLFHISCLFFLPPLVVSSERVNLILAMPSWLEAKVLYDLFLIKFMFSF